MTRILLLFLVISLLYPNLAFSQNEHIIPTNGRTYTQIFDSLSTGLIPARIPHGALYDRVFPWTNLTGWSNGDTISLAGTLQSWYDLEMSVIDNQYVKNYTTVRDSALNNVLRKNLPVMVIDFKFASIDTNAFDDGRLSEIDGILTDNNLENHPYNQHQVTFATLAGDRLWQNEEYMLFIDSTWLLSNTGQAIKEIVVTNTQTEQNDTINAVNDAYITFPDSGKILIKFDVELTTGAVFSTYQQVYVRYKVSTYHCDDPENQIVESDIPFQGYDETDATTSIGNYVVYYRFKQGSSTDCEHKLQKPVIILDGFDPLDEREPFHTYSYLEYNGGANDLGRELRQEGYDVIILNFPVLGSEHAADKFEVKSYTGSNYNGIVNRLGRDGGADYIERNAFILVKLIQQINDELVANNSNEQLVIIGPSMGGQISRYALAYMEERHAASIPKMNHNTRLWISFDSPHLGANIPLGSQYALAFFGYKGGQQAAVDALEKKLRSKAARQMLIEQLDGFNHQATFHQTYTSNLTSNGLPNSDGFPLNLRKISLINGSGASINTSYPTAEYLNMEGRKTILNIKVLELITNYLANTGQPHHQVFKGRFSIGKWLPPQIRIIDNTIFFQNNNPNGSMDVIPGGTYNSQGELKASIDAVAENKGLDIIWNKYLINHTFIPTVSALAFIDPAFHWSSAVNNRNLVCNSEIPFDNYFTPSVNEDHVFLSSASADWVKQEIQKGSVNCPTICAFALTGGSNWICSGTNYTYTLDVAPPTGVTTTWSVSNGISIVSSNSTSITVTSNGYNPSATITSTLENSCGADGMVKRTIGSGQPGISISFEQIGNSCNYEAVANHVNASFTYEWSEDGVNYTAGSGSFPHKYGLLIPGESKTIWLRLTTSCGVSNTSNTFNIQDFPPGCTMKRALDENDKGPGSTTSIPVKVNPNPASNSFKITGNSSANYNLTVIDVTGRVLTETVFIGQIEINSSSFAKGLYLVVVINSETKEREIAKLIVQ